MPTPTHSGSRARRGFASSALWATDRVIGRISRRLRRDRSTSGIILGKSAAVDWGRRPGKAGFLPHLCPPIATIGECLSGQPLQSPSPEAIFDETPVV